MKMTGVTRGYRREVASTPEVFTRHTHHQENIISEGMAIWETENSY